MEFKNALAAWASGVAVATTRTPDGHMYGLTVSSFISVSLEPPLILVSIADTNRLPAMVEESKAFAVSILHLNQQQASNHFASSGREPTLDYTEIHGHSLQMGQPVVADAAAHLGCELHQSVVAGDHVLLIGRVVEATVNNDVQPLLYYKRAYRTVTGD